VIEGDAVVGKKSGEDGSQAIALEGGVEGHDSSQAHDPCLINEGGPSCSHQTQSQLGSEPNSLLLEGRLSERSYRWVCGRRFGRSAK
jgi:hypothetical protein